MVESKIANIEDYEIVNTDKWERALHGSLGRVGRLEGGVGDDASDMAKLAAYDRLGGLVRKNGRKIKTGAFYDFREKKDRVIPEIEYVFIIDGEEVLIAEDEELPLEVRAAEKKDQKKHGVISTGVKKSGAKKVAQTDGGTETREEVEVNIDADISADEEE